jgi:hypothetical protein
VRAGRTGEARARVARRRRRDGCRPTLKELLLLSESTIRNSIVSMTSRLAIRLRSTSNAFSKLSCK